jgi:hypothetical protein
VTALGAQSSAWRRLGSRPLSVDREVAIVALVLLCWQAVRIPLEGSVGVSLAHADEWRSAERFLHIDIESSLLAFGRRDGVDDVLTWAYGNLHLPVIVGFLVAARLLAEGTYVRLRWAFVLLHVPALVVIGLYPLAPPRWVPALGGHPPTEDALSAGISAWLKNSTAAAVSEHFGYALFVALAALWIGGRRLAWAFLYPAFVFVVILGTGNHYVLDCAVGGATVILGLLAARALWRVPGVAARGDDPGRAAALAIVSAYVLIAWGAEDLASHPGSAAAAAAVGIGVGLRIVARRAPVALR